MNIFKKFKDAKSWIAENPETVCMYLVTGLSSVGLGLVLYKLHRLDTKCVSFSKPDHSLRPTFMHTPVAIKDMGIIGKRILQEQPLANSNDLVEYTLIYDVLKD